MDPIHQIVTIVLGQSKKNPDPAISVIERFGLSGAYPYRAAASIMKVLAEDDPRRLMLLSLAGHVVVFQRGTPAPGVPGATLEVATDSSLVLNAAGRVCFQASMAGAGVTTSNATGVWT